MFIQKKYEYGFYDALDIAKYVINKACEEKNPVSNIELQIILYYIQVNFIILYDELAFPEDLIATRCGVAIKEVYIEYCYRNYIIESYPNTGLKISDKHKRIINMVIEVVKKEILGNLICNITRNDEHPWKKYFNGGFNIYEYNIIPINEIAEYVIKKSTKDRKRREKFKKLCKEKVVDITACPEFQHNVNNSYSKYSTNNVIPFKKKQ